MSLWRTVENYPLIIIELPHEKTNKVTRAPSLIIVFTVHSIGS